MSALEDRLEYFVERRAAGQLDAADLAELRELCNDAAFARKFVEISAEDHEWRTWLGPGSYAASFTQVVVARSRKAKASGRFVKAVAAAAQHEQDSPQAAEVPQERTHSKRRRRLWRRSPLASTWLPALLAAGVLAAVLLFLLKGSGPGEPVVKAPDNSSKAPPPKLPDNFAKAPETSPNHIAQIISFTGEAKVQRGTQTLSAANGLPLCSGDLLHAPAPLRIRFVSDDTTVDLQGEATVSLTQHRKRVELSTGSLSASIAPQAQPMLLSTGGAEAKVLGTRLSLALQPDAARLQVDEGRVQFTRIQDGASLEVNSGEVALAPLDPKLALSVKPLRKQWLECDIGTTKWAGSASFGEPLTVHGSGSDLWELKDGFHFVYQPLNADGEITACIREINSTGDWALAGVMIREKLSADSVHATMMTTTQGKAKFRRRAHIGANTESTGPSAGTLKLPLWVKVSRRGQLFTAYWSADGKRWNQVGTDNIKMTGAYVGLVVLAHNNAGLASAVFESVEVKIK